MLRNLIFKNNRNDLGPHCGIVFDIFNLQNFNFSYFQLFIISYFHISFFWRVEGVGGAKAFYEHPKS
jgi:hypothetical protein